MGPTVTIRYRKVKKGQTQNIYLDIYLKRGIRRRETLEGLYLYPKPKSYFEKDHNKMTKLRAEEIRISRLSDLSKGVSPKARKRVFLEEFFTELMNERKGTNFGNWDSCLKHLKVYFHSGTTIDQIDHKDIQGFKNFLMEDARTKSDQRLQNNSCISYFNKFRACINEAFNRGLITENPLRGVKSIKPQDTERQYLTQSELKLLESSDCINPIIKKAFLFSCYTGLRFSDINRLKWEDLHANNGKYEIHFRQQKTKAIEYHPLNKNAFEIISSLPQSEAGKVFRSLRYSGHNNNLLREWIYKAGIKKHITFHSGRHTFATLILSKTNNIYLVSKLLGHSEIKTTAIYAKIVNDQKRHAVELLDAI